MAVETASEGTPKDQDNRQLTTFIKYFSDDERVIRGIFQDQKIRFTQPAALNDPLEFNPIIRFKDGGENYRNFVLNGMLYPSEEWRLRIGLVGSQMNRFGILSLTKVPDSFDMWSHYANGHKGFLIEFKADFNKHPCMISQSEGEYPIREVTYVEEYAIDIQEVSDDENFIAHQAFNEKMFFTKTSRWAYEEEYRVVRNLADYPGWKPLDNKWHRDPNVYLFDFSLECVESVTFGACMPRDKKKAIIDACKDTGIGFVQAVIFRDRKDRLGKPGKVELIPANDIPNFLDIHEFIWEEKYIEERKNPIVINHKSELPYYADNQEWVEEYEQNRKKRLGGGSNTDIS